MEFKNRETIKVLLVDGHPALRAGVRACLADESILVVGEASNGDEALQKMKQLSPNVIILESSLPSIDGGELTRRLRRLDSKTRIIVFSALCGEAHVVRMARCGAHGYVMKDASTARLVEAVRQVHAGGLHFPADMADAILVSEFKPCPGEDAAAGLTGRERDVLVLLSDGSANKEVARVLGISVRTAETHRERLSRKLNIRSVAGLTKYALQQGLTSL